MQWISVWDQLRGEMGEGWIPSIIESYIRCKQTLDFNGRCLPWSTGLSDRFPRTTGSEDTERWPAGNVGESRRPQRLRDLSTGTQEGGRMERQGG